MKRELVVARQPDQASHTSEPRGDAREYLVFTVGEERHATPLTRIEQIVRVPTLTPVPRARAHVLGLMSLRGQVVTVLDLRVMMRHEAAPIDRRSRVLIVAHAGESLGLLCDQVLDVQPLRADEIESMQSLHGSSSSHVLGVARPAQRKPRAESRERTPRGDGELLVLVDLSLLLRSCGHG